MPIKVKNQKDYLLTEVTMDLPTSVSEIDALMRSIKASGKVVILYQDGGIMGVNVEQKKKTTPAETEKVKHLLGVTTTER
jgi:hypothetical protein